MKSITVNLFAIFVLLISCDTSKKSTHTNSKNQTSETSITKDSVSIKNIKWKLVTLMGKDVSDKKAFIMFSDEDNKVFGHGSCNNFSGTYQLKEGNQITLSKMTATLMACIDMEVENQFMAILEKADNYSLNDKTMTLNKAKMAPLAIFEAVKTE